MGAPKRRTLCRGRCLIGRHWTDAMVHPHRFAGLTVISKTHSLGVGFRCDGPRLTSRQEPSAELEPGVSSGNLRGDAAVAHGRAWKRSTCSQVMFGPPLSMPVPATFQLLS